MLERRIATYDKTNFRKRLNEFLEVAKIYKQDDLNEHNIYQFLYKIILQSLFLFYELLQAFVQLILD